MTLGNINTNRTGETQSRGIHTKDNDRMYMVIIIVRKTFQDNNLQINLIINLKRGINYVTVLVLVIENRKYWVNKDMMVLIISHTIVQKRCSENFYSYYCLKQINTYIRPVDNIIRIGYIDNSENTDYIVIIYFIKVNIKINNEHITR